MTHPKPLISELKYERCAVEETLASCEGAVIVRVEGIVFEADETSSKDDARDG